MEKKYFLLRRENIILIFCLLVIFSIYVVYLTKSGLWYDEGIEYFYSKYLGVLPEGVQVNAEGKTNMYMRICSTFQPPLYNVLMYFWLLLFDGVNSFRFIGILFTFIGALGFFKTIKLLSNDNWAIGGIVVYLLTNSIVYYGLECGEYYLMLCMESWALYYFTSFFKAEEYNTSKKKLIGFLLFAVLSAYSQYGAILLMAPLYSVLFINILKRKDKKLIVFLFLSTVFVLVVFALPLLYYFLIPQMGHQNSIGVSHALVFQKNVIYSFFLGIFSILNFLFVKTIPLFLLSIVLLACFLSFIGLLSKNKFLFSVWGTLVLVYILYFVLVATSFYAYNEWDGKRGCYNFGDRYTLYMAPLILLAIVYGIYNLMGLIKRNILLRKSLNICVIVLVISFSFLNVWYLGWEKDSETRDAYHLWESVKGYNQYTLIDNFENPPFQFYFQHSKHYNSTSCKNVIGEGGWSLSGTPDVIYQKQDSMGVYKHPIVLFISANKHFKSEKLKNNDIAMKRAGYKRKFLLDKRKDDKVSVIMYYK